GRLGQEIADPKGDWKLVKGPGAGAERRGADGTADTEGAQLFNLAKDIGEQTNLADKEPEKVKELAAAWNAWNRDNIPAKWTQGRKRAQQSNSVPATNIPATPALAAKADGPWKSGDTLTAEQAPQIA